MKHVFVFFAIILALIPAVYAEDDKWIDGIRFRFVTSSPDDCEFKNPVEFKSPVSCGKNPIGIYMPWKIEDRFSPYFSDAPRNDAAAIAVDNRREPLFLFALELPETLMTSWSFRGGLFEFELPKELKDLGPDGYGGSVAGDVIGRAYKRQSSKIRTSLYNDFFNASDKAFADANPDWAMSTDVTSSRIFLGYTWGVFFPIGENHRFFKVGAGLGVYYIDLSLKMNLCSQYIVTPKGDPYSDQKYIVECIGKTEIDSYSGKKLGVASASFVNLFERRTKDSIWRFVQISSGVALGSNDKGYIRAKLKNHRSLALFIGSETWEIITYTYRF